MKLKYYMRGVGVGILFTAFMFVAVIIPNLKFENKIKSAADAGAADEVQSQVAELVGNVSGSSQAEKEVLEEAGPSKDNTVTEDSEKEAAQEIEEAGAEAEAESNTKAGAEAEAEGDTEAETETEAEPEADTEDDAVEVNAEVKAEAEAEEKTEVEIKEETETEETVPAQNNTSETVKTKEATFSNRHVKAVRNDDTETVELYIYSGCASEEVAEALCKVGLVKDTTEFDNYLMNAGYANNIHTGTYKFEFGTSYSKIGKKITER